MKLLILLPAISVLALSAGDCGKKNKEAIKYKGRFEIKAICSNYTISLLEGAIDTSLVAAAWTDETTNKTYRNVFALGNPCSFPPALRQGDEFYFIIDTAKSKDCIICMAYYPKPAKALSIKVVEK
ncbi:MAG: hypothetical protein H7Y01_02025 [Ferruginibacter sp.]|nr:hypothetical protein [Chitinophagaceae bacterium]